MDFSITFLFQTMKLEALGLGSTKNGEHTLMVAISLTDSGLPSDSDQPCFTSFFLWMVFIPSLIAGLLVGLPIIDNDKVICGFSSYGIGISSIHEWKNQPLLWIILYKFI